MTRRPPSSTLFPYTTLFRSVPTAGARRTLVELAQANLLNEYAIGRYSTHDLLRAYAAELITPRDEEEARDRKSTRLNSSHSQISYAVFCLKKKKKKKNTTIK